MRMTRMTAAAMMIALGTTAGLASAQDALGGKTAEQVIAAEQEALGGAVGMPTLITGDQAPELKVATFVKGAPISEFEAGSAYLVDFWATWCGPCIASIPKLTEMQEKYANDNFTVLAVSIWENKEGDELIDHVTGFVEKRDSEMGYTIAIDDNGAMADSWMSASGQGGIPTAMLVDREGRIAWIGYGTDKALPGVVEQVVNGTWDLEAAREARLAEAENMAAANAERAWFGHFAELAEKGEQQRAAALASALHSEGVMTNPQALNGVAWTIVENDGWDKASIKVARDLAASALDSVGGNNAAILDTLAWAHYRLGDYDKAIEVQTKAVENAPSQMKAELEQNLETFKARGG